MVNVWNPDPDELFELVMWIVTNRIADTDEDDLETIGLELVEREGKALLSGVPFQMLHERSGQYMLRDLMIPYLGEGKFMNLNCNNGRV